MFGYAQAAFGDLVLENGEGGGNAVRRPGRPNAVKKFVKLGLPALIKDSKVIACTNLSTYIWSCCLYMHLVQCLCQAGAACADQGH
jgi:hypothetical protein